MLLFSVQESRTQTCQFVIQGQKIFNYETQDSAFLSLPKFSRLASIEAMACAVLHIPQRLIKGWIPKTLILTYLIIVIQETMKGSYASQGP